MSLENAKKFLNEIAKDEALKERLAGKDSTEVLAAAKELGLECSVEEMEEAAKGTAELSPEEMADVSGGGILDFFHAMLMAWDIHNCENNNHDFVWQGEVESEVHFNVPYYYQYKILVCTKCGKKKVTNDYKIVGDMRASNN